MNLHIAIQNAVVDHGHEVILTNRLINILDDLHVFSDHIAYKSVLKQLFERNYNQEIHLLDEQGLSEQAIRFTLDDISLKASQRLGLSLDLVRYSVDSIAYGIGIIHNIQQPNSEIEPLSNSVIGLWDFFYKEGKCMTLTIKRDGTAIASSGTKYQWKCPSNNSIIIFLEGFVEYCGSIDNSLIHGVAQNFLDFRKWPWHAKLRGDGITKANLTDGRWTIKNNIDDLEDNNIEFLPNGVLKSSLYDDGTWNIEGDKLIFTTANGFITYSASLERGKLTGDAFNSAGYRWNFELIKQ